MIHAFITDKELDLGMKKYFRDHITNGDTNKHIMVASEGAAFSMIKTKLNNRFDVAQLFPSIKEYDNERAYLVDEYACKNDLVYKCIQAGTGHDPAEADSEYWEQNDPRDMLLVRYAACMTVYFMLESVNPRKITDELFNDFETAMDWLNDVRDGKESPDWPRPEEGGSDDIPHGSNEPNDYYW